MSLLEITCPNDGCENVFHREVPDGDRPGARWLRAIAQRQQCDECIERQQCEDAVQAKVEQREARRAHCQIPRLYRNQRVEDLEAKPGQEAALEASAAWASAPEPGGLMLTGEVGTGKTLFATAACWSRLDHSRCTYASVARSMAQLGADFDDEGRKGAIRVFSGHGPIVLDDLDKCRPTDYGLEHLFSAIDARYQAGAAMLVTTNLTPSQIGDRFGDPVMSRLVGYCRVVQMAGGDRRLEQKAERVRAA